MASHEDSRRSQLTLYFVTVSALHRSRRLMAGIIKESGIRSVTTFYLFNLYCAGESVELNFLLLEIITFFSLYIRNDQSSAKSSYM